VRTVPEAALDQAGRHAADADRLVKRQQGVLAELVRRRDNHRTLDAANVLLQELVLFRRLAVQHLEREKTVLRESRAHAIRSKIFWPPDEIPRDTHITSIEESSRRAIALSRAQLLESK
jgi:hypothetical protein